MLEKEVWAEMARRKKMFYPNDQWDKIKLWGLFQYSDIKEFLKRGELITDMKPENRTIWVKPSKEAYHKHIKPLLMVSVGKLTTMAGW